MTAKKTTTTVTTDAAKVLVDPDLTPDTIENEAEISTAAIAPFIPAKIRATLYTVCGAGAIVAAAIGITLGGEIGSVLEIVAAGLTGINSALAVSHVSTK